MEISKNKKQKRDDFWPWEIPSIISKEEEIELATRSMNGDIDARMKLITSNMRIIISLAYSMGKSNEEIKEYISEGMMGATVAASRYDPSFNVRFCTYAMWWVRAHIVKYKKYKRGFYLPHKYFQIRKELSKLYTKTGKNYTDDLLIQEVSSKLELKQERIKDILKMSMTEVSLEDKTIDDKTIFDILPSETLSPEQEFFNKEDSLKNKSETLYALSLLTDRESSIVKGILIENKTFAEIGSRFGITKQRTKQIYDRVIMKMKKSIVERRYSQSFYETNVA